jgi:Ankyrin repeats (3 copies)
MRGCAPFPRHQSEAHIYKGVTRALNVCLAMQCTHCARSAVTVRERANKSNVFCDSQCQTEYYAKANTQIGSGILLWLKDVSPAKSAEYGRDLFFAEFLKYTPADAAALLEVLAQPNEDTRARRQQIEEWLHQRTDWRARKVFKAAVARGYARAVEFLITRHFADIDDPIFDIYLDYKVPAIQYAASITGNAKIVRILVEHGTADAYVKRAFYWAAHDGHVDVIRTLIEIGNPDIDARDGALYVAAENGHPDTVRVLLGTETSFRAHNSALWVASDEWISSKMSNPLSMQIIRMLLDAGADPSGIPAFRIPALRAVLDEYRQAQEATQKRQRIRQCIQ